MSEQIPATFSFIMKYPIQLLIGGGIFLIASGQIIKTVSATYGINEVMKVGAQTTYYGWFLTFFGTFIFLVYVFRKKIFP